MGLAEIRGLRQCRPISAEVELHREVDAEHRAAVDDETGEANLAFSYEAVGRVGKAIELEKRVVVDRARDPG